MLGSQFTLDKILYTLEFDKELRSRRLVSGKSKLQQFANSQQALSNAVSSFCLQVLWR